MRDSHDIEDWFSPGGPRVPRFWAPALIISVEIVALLLLWRALL